MLLFYLDISFLLVIQPFYSVCRKPNKVSSVLSKAAVTMVMSQSFPTGYIPPGQPRGIFFERANPGHPGNFFCPIPCPGAKNSPGVGQNFPTAEETAPY